MQIMARSYGYPELLEQLRGKKVYMWTCNTCARICGVGGDANARSLGERLAADGIDIVGYGSTGASCIASNIRKCQTPEIEDCGIVLSLTCGIGAELCGRISGKEVLNPVCTLGAGYRDDGKVCRLMRTDGSDPALSEEAERRGLPPGPFRGAPEGPAYLYSL